MIRYIFQRMQNFAYKRFIVNWVGNLRSQLALDASFARHEARHEALVQRGMSRDRGFRLIWKVSVAFRVRIRVRLRVRVGIPSHLEGERRFPGHN